MRIELVDGKAHRAVADHLDQGKIDVSRRNRSADCVLRRTGGCSAGSPQENAFAAVLRGAVTVEGDPKLFALFQRLLRGLR